MLGLLKAGVWLVPALAVAAFLPPHDGPVSSAIITLPLSASRDWTTDEGSLTLRFDVLESTEPCSVPSVTVNQQTLPQEGHGQLSGEDGTAFEATWSFVCVAYDAKPRELLMSFNVSSINGEAVDDVRLGVRFQQTHPANILDFPGTFAMVTQADVPPMPDAEENDLETELEELEYLRERAAELEHRVAMKEQHIRETFGWEATVESCDSLKCHITTIFEKIHSTVVTVYEHATGGGNGPDGHPKPPHWRGPKFRKPHFPRPPHHGHHGNHTHGNHTHPPHHRIPHFPHFCRPPPHHPPHHPKKPPHGPPEEPPAHDLPPPPLRPPPPTDGREHPIPPEAPSPPKAPSSPDAPTPPHRPHRRPEHGRPGHFGGKGEHKFMPPPPPPPPFAGIPHPVRIVGSAVLLTILLTALHRRCSRSRRWREERRARRQQSWLERFRARRARRAARKAAIKRFVGKVKAFFRVGREEEDKEARQLRRESSRRQQAEEAQRQPLTTSESSESDLDTTMEQEIAQFRTVATVVGEMVAAEEGRAAHHIQTTRGIPLPPSPVSLPGYLTEEEDDDDDDEELPPYQGRRSISAEESIVTDGFRYTPGSSEYSPGSTRYTPSNSSGGSVHGGSVDDVLTDTKR